MGGWLRNHIQGRHSCHCIDKLLLYPSVCRTANTSYYCAWWWSTNVRYQTICWKVTLNDITELISESELKSFMACTKHSPEHRGSMYHKLWPSFICDISIYCCISLSKRSYHFTQQLTYWGHWRKHVWKYHTLYRYRCNSFFTLSIEDIPAFVNIAFTGYGNVDDMRGLAIQQCLFCNADFMWCHVYNSYASTHYS